MRPRRECWHSLTAAAESTALFQYSLTIDPESEMARWELWYIAGKTGKPIPEPDGIGNRYKLLAHGIPLGLSETVVRVVLDREALGLRDDSKIASHLPVLHSMN